MSKYKIIGELDYIMGHLRYGHMELTIDKEEWDSLTKEEQNDYLRYDADFVLDDYSLEDTGEITNITVNEIK